MDIIATPLSTTCATKEESLKRCLQGYFLLKRYPNATIIFSGYGGFDEISNAKIMANFAILGIKSNKIIILENPRDTIEEALAIKNIVKINILF